MINAKRSIGNRHACRFGHQFGDRLFTWEERPCFFFTVVSGVLAATSRVLGGLLIVEWLEPGLVPRLPAAILAASIIAPAQLRRAAQEAPLYDRSIEWRTRAFIAYLNKYDGQIVYQDGRVKILRLTAVATEPTPFGTGLGPISYECCIRIK